MPKAKLTYILKWIAALSVAAGSKFYYSSAGVNELRWILAPTASLVEWATWSSFSFESYVGYMNREHTYLIAASCSGVNFLIAAFLMLSLGRLWNERPGPTHWSFLVKAGATAYFATLIANTVRISVAMQMQGLAPAVGWLDEEGSHRLLGIVIYFGSLLLLFVLAGNTDADERLYPEKAPGLLRRSIWPLTAYYAVTLGIPLLNGAFQQGNGFWRHSLFVLLTPILIIAIISGLRKTIQDHRRKAW